MPRTARVVLPDYPHHVIQRGHNKAPVFVHERDYLFFLHLLEEWKARLGCRVHAYCLMTNHVHMVIDPGSDSASLGVMMKRIAGRYTRYVNRIEERTGTVWNGRYKSSLIETDAYFLACCRYVELNPVRAGMVASPGEYRWSSYAHNSGSIVTPWLDEHSVYAALGPTREVRRKRYRCWVHEAIPQEEWDQIRSAVRRGQLTGGGRFRKLVEGRLGRRVGYRPPGRPSMGSDDQDPTYPASKTDLSRGKRSMSG